MDFSPDTCSIDIPNKTHNGNLDPYTALFWAYPFGFTTGDRLASKHASINRILRFGNSSSSAANFNIERKRATTDLKYETSGTPAKTGKWQFFVVRLDTASTGNQADLFLGDLGTPAVQQSYGTFTNGTGALTSDTGSKLWIGSQASAGTATFNGLIAFCAYFAQAMTLEQIREQQFNPHVTGKARVFMLPGSNGLGLVEDLAPFRNHGTVAGSPILADGSAVLSLFRKRRRVFKAPAAEPAAGNPWYQYQQQMAGAA